MKANQLIFALIVLGFTANTFAAKPPPKPAGDVDCDGCVGTADIEDEAVTTEKLSTQLQQQINQLQAENNAQQAQIDAIPKSVIWVDANGVMIGDAQTASIQLRALVYFDVDGLLYVGQLCPSCYIPIYPYYYGDTTAGLFYDLTGCMGNAYVEALNGNFMGDGIVVQTSTRGGIFYGATGDLLPMKETQSIWYSYPFSGENGECLDNLSFQDLYLATPIIDTNIYTKPYKLKLIPAN